MAKVYDSIHGKLRDFMERQKVFFVATAPSDAEGHINLSPKGLPGTFCILDDQTLAYLDLTGSGVETIAHLRENGRICVMFCAFEGPPRIVRVHGAGEVIEPHDEQFRALAEKFEPYRGVRSIIRIRAHRISDSCGYGVPLYEHKGEREQLQKWAEHKGPEGIAEYQRDNNAQSIDGIPSQLGKR
ncbi:MAG: pyridoxamine 5'-phosphate oxidase family protein [Myxococcales bacterium]|jgi:hypothetical protein